MHFVTLSDGWAMADNDQSGFTDLFTSDDGGRRWHDVTPPVVLAGDNAGIDDPSHNLDMEKTPGGPIEDRHHASPDAVRLEQPRRMAAGVALSSYDQSSDALGVHDFRRWPEMGAARAVPLGRAGWTFFS